MYTRSHTLLHLLFVHLEHACAIDDDSLCFFCVLFVYWTTTMTTTMKSMMIIMINYYVCFYSEERLSWRSSKCGIRNDVFFFKNMNKKIK